MADQTLNDQATTGSVQQSDFIKVSRAGVDTKELVSNIPVSSAIQTALDGKKNDFTENAAFNKDFGAISGSVVEGDDSRLSDSRTCDNTFDNAATAKTNLALVKADVGLGNVDNTSDIDKPVSTLTQTAIDNAVGGVLVVKNLPNTTILLNLSDAGALINTLANAPVNVIIPNDVSISFDIGTSIALFQDGTGLVSLTASLGVIIKSDSGFTSLSGQYTSGSLTKVDTDTWQFVGNLS